MKMEGWKINKELVWPKAMYFWAYGANSFFIPFVPIYLDAVGLNSLDIGVVFSIRPFLGFFCMPFWGYLADKLGKPKLILVFVMVCAGFFRLSLLSATSTFVVLVILFVSDFFGQAIEPMMDSACLDMLPDPMLFGKQRIWGAIGWGWIGAPIAGAILSQYGMTAIFFCHAAGLLVTLAIVLHFNVKSTPSEGSMLDVAWVVVKDRRTSVFFLSTLVIGQGFGVVFSFLFLFLKELGDSGLVMGVSIMVTCVTEVPVMYCVDTIIKRMGLMKSVFFCLYCKSMRFAWYAIMQEPWSVLWVEGLHGVVFGIAWAGATVYCRKIAPDGMGATMQGFFTGWFFGIGAGSGSLVAGALGQEYGLRTMFGIVAAWTFAVATLCTVADSLNFIGKANKQEDSFYEEFEDDKDATDEVPTPPGVRTAEEGEGMEMQKVVSQSPRSQIRPTRVEVQVN